MKGRARVPRGGKWRSWRAKKRDTIELRACFVHRFATANIMPVSPGPPRDIGDCLPIQLSKVAHYDTTDVRMRDTRSGWYTAEDPLFRGTCANVLYRRVSITDRGEMIDDRCRGG